MTLRVNTLYNSICVLSMLLSCTAMAQVKTDLNKEIKVSYKDNEEERSKPAYFINGVHYPEANITFLNPNNIDSFDVLKSDTVINNVTYSGKLLIKTKASFAPRLITLNQLKTKYVNLSEKPVVFTIDGNIIHSDYNLYTVDENYILQIIVEKYQNKAEQLGINFVNIELKTDKNIKKLNNILIRGEE